MVATSAFSSDRQWFEHGLSAIVYFFWNTDYQSIFVSTALAQVGTVLKPKVVTMKAVTERGSNSLKVNGMRPDWHET